MQLSILAFLVSMIAATALTPVARAVGIRIGAIDRAANGRKVHLAATPRTGGLAIVAGFLLSIVVAGLLAGWVDAITRRDVLLAAGLVAGGLCVAALGLADDLRGVRPGTKVLFQIAAALIAWTAGHRVEAITLPFAGDVALGPLGLPFTLLWIVGLSNAMNLVDGLDGLAAGIALFALSAFAAIAGMNGALPALAVSAMVAGSVLGFLRYNLHPASIFMGDAGSTFLGFVLAVTSLHTGNGGPARLSILVPIVALALPLGDTILAMARRALRGAPLSRADRGHVHHRLLAVGLSHRRAVLVLHVAAGILAAAAVALTVAPPVVVATSLLVLSASALLALRRLGFLRPDRALEVLRERRRNQALQAEVRGLASRLRGASCPGAVLEALLPFATALGGRAVALHLSAGEPPHAPLGTIEHGFSGPTPMLTRTRHELEPGRTTRALEIGWPQDLPALDRDVEIAIELSCELVSDAIRRLGRPRRTSGPLPPRETREVPTVRQHA